MLNADPDWVTGSVRTQQRARWEKNVVTLCAQKNAQIYTEIEVLL